MTPGFLMDMFRIRADYDVRLNGGKPVRRALGC